MNLTQAELAAMIDHTALRPDVVAAEIRALCAQARQWNFAAACVAPCWIELAAHELQGSTVKVAGVAGFPHGNTLSSIKAAETSRAIAAGAREIDMVANIGLLKMGEHAAVGRDIEAVVTAARTVSGVIVKVIFETAFLSDAEKLDLCRLCEDAGADFVKTSTGFASAGATIQDIALMRRAVGPRLGVKAAGGIRDLDAARAMIDAGANRLGSSASVAIMEQLAAQAG